MAPRWMRCFMIAWTLAGGLHAEAAPPLQQPSGTRAAEESRTAEIAVELAWLGDAATFPYPLRAKCQNGVVELHGPLPTEGLRAKAVALAQEAAALPVADRLTLQPNMALLLPVAPDERFPEEAKARLFSLGEAEGKQLELKATRDGKLFIAGAAATAEERLGYSKVFRGLAGCRLVRNEMSVGPAAFSAASAMLSDVPRLGEPTTTAASPPRLEAPRGLPRLQPPVKLVPPLNKDGSPAALTMPGPDSGRPGRISW